MVELRISELSRRSGVPPSTLRYYGDIGLLPAARTRSGYRSYDLHAEDRLRFISAAKRLRLPLSSIRDLLAVWESDACRAVKAELRPVLTQRLGATCAAIDELAELRTTLQAAVDRLDALPDRDAKCDPDCTFLNTAPAIACALEPGDIPTRLTQWHNLIRGDAPRWSAHGATVRLPSGRAADMAALILAEQACCPFLDFSLTFDRATVILAITAPAGAESVIEALLSDEAGTMA